VDVVGRPVGKGRRGRPKRPNPVRRGELTFEQEGNAAQAGDPCGYVQV
jgi:hypothetical protein